MGENFPLFSKQHKFTKFLSAWSDNTCIVRINKCLIKANYSQL